MKDAGRDEVLAMRRRSLRETLLSGYAIDPRALDDSEYRGISLGLPAWMERLSWKTFQKVFHRDPATGGLRGWNVRVEQRGLEAASEPKLRDGKPWTFGHYVVRDLPARAPRGLARGLLIDYSPERGFMSRLRDPIVALREGSVELLLGWSYVDLGLAIPTPSYFLLEREKPLGRVEPAPRG